MGLCSSRCAGGRRGSAASPSPPRMWWTREDGRQQGRIAVVLIWADERIFLPTVCKDAESGASARGMPANAGPAGVCVSICAIGRLATAAAGAGIYDWVLRDIHSPAPTQHSMATRSAPRPTISGGRVHSPQFGIPEDSDLLPLLRRAENLFRSIHTPMWSVGAVLAGNLDTLRLVSRWSVATERAPYTPPLAYLVRSAEARLEIVWAGKLVW